MMIKLGVLIALIASLGGNPEEREIYTRTMYITALDYNSDVVYCVDAVGHEWAYCGCEDYNLGDLVTCTMVGCGQPNYIWDDVIIKTTYTGFWVNMDDPITDDLEILTSGM